MIQEGPPVVAKPEIDLLLSDVKNDRNEGEKGVVTLGEIAADLGFENRCTVSEKEEAAQISTEKLQGIIRGRYNRVFVSCTIKFRSRIVKAVFLVHTGGVNTFVGKPTWDRLFEGLEDIGSDAVKVTFCGIHFEEITMSPQDSHFSDIDILGSDFLKRVNAKLLVDYGSNTCELVWTMP
jgi:hypothetical protein